MSLNVDFSAHSRSVTYMVSCKWLAPPQCHKLSSLAHISYFPNVTYMWLIMNPYRYVTCIDGKIRSYPQNTDKYSQYPSSMNQRCWKDMCIHACGCACGCACACACPCACACACACVCVCVCPEPNNPSLCGPNLDDMSRYVGTVRIRIGYKLITHNLRSRRHKNIKEMFGELYFFTKTRFQYRIPIPNMVTSRPYPKTQSWLKFQYLSGSCTGTAQVHNFQINTYHYLTRNSFAFVHFKSRNYSQKDPSIFLNCWIFLNLEIQRTSPEVALHLCGAIYSIR